ncbi:MAG: hypothetical protein MI700_08205 [Balneolales bacterium]|nr:hypothetical protein [Balneolales bacterium]
MRLQKILLSAFFSICALQFGYSQEGVVTPYTDIRFAYFGNTDEATGLGYGVNEAESDFFGIRIRTGLRYAINKNNSFVARLATQLRDNTNGLRFTIKADGSGIAPGSISFDEFYYQFSDEKTKVKIGRFQQSVPVLSNAGRSSFRFQSNVIFIHWSDGVYLQRDLNNGWYGEFIGEYQPQGATTFAYRPGLNFGNNEHNFTTYFGLENRERDQFNFIQKGFGLFYTPNSFSKNGEFTYFLGVMGRIVHDIPATELLNGGSFRFAAELSQNLNSSFEDGTGAIISAGINRFGGKHEFMVELSRKDRYWLTPSTYAPGNDELELRYRLRATSKLWFDARYRVRVNHNDNLPYAYSTFIRANYTL